MLDSFKIVEKQSKAFHTFLWHFFPSLIQNFIAYRSSKVSDCIFEIHLLWQSGFSRAFSNCCCSCSFEPEIIKISQPSHKMYSNNILNFQESTTILNACPLKSWNLLNAPRIYIYIYIYIYTQGRMGEFSSKLKNKMPDMEISSSLFLDSEYHVLL